MSGHYAGLEQHHVLRFHTDGATFLVFWEHELHEVEDGCVGVMSLFSEQGREPTVRFHHEVDYDHQVLRIWVERRWVR